jgi:glycosyltransferase involved in cell wall biosynthesis
MRNYSKVRVIHLPERSGLVRARLRGVQGALAPILIFLDSHIECGDGQYDSLLLLFLLEGGILCVCVCVCVYVCVCVRERGGGRG